MDFFPGIMYVYYKLFNYPRKRLPNDIIQINDVNSVSRS